VTTGTVHIEIDKASGIMLKENYSLSNGKNLMHSFIEYATSDRHIHGVKGVFQNEVGIA
jgi:hypothetical protein